MDDKLSPVAATSIGVARIRARESTRADRLFDDPFAAAFAAAGGAAGESVPTSPDRLRVALYVQVVVRTRFYDEQLLAATAAGCRQVVLLGAGLDARAFRLDWPDGVRMFELDQPEVVEFKDRVLRELGATPRCARTVVPVDLREDWPGALRRTGFDPAVSTAWLAEGLLVYLDAADAARLLSTVTAASAGGSRLVTEAGRAPAELAALSGDVAGGVTSLWRGGLGADVAVHLRAEGWDVDEVRLADLAAGYGRPAPSATAGFVSAVRR
jgi:methyltransferase (TIGR00027 family)